MRFTVQCIHFLTIVVLRAFLPKLNECDTDDDVAMCFLKSKDGFEKYVHYLVGQGQAESAVSDKTVHRFFKVLSFGNLVYLLTCERATHQYNYLSLKIFLSSHCRSTLRKSKPVQTLQVPLYAASTPASNNHWTGFRSTRPSSR